MMPRNSIPIDGEPCGVLAVPISEVGDTRFIDFLKRLYDALGRSGGNRIIWRPIDNPRKTDAAYENLRTEEQKRSDEYSANKFDSYTRNRGSEDHHVAREYNTLAESLGISDEDRPCILFASNPSVGPRPILHIPKELLGNPETLNALGDLLVESISEDLVDAVLENGYLTEESMYHLNNQICEIEAQVQTLIGNGPRSASVPQSGSYAKLIGPDGIEYIGKSRYEETCANRRLFNLIVDVLEECVYCKNGRMMKKIKTRHRAIGILADIIVADRPIEVEKTRTGSNCVSTSAAYNTFCEGRKILQDNLKGGPKLFARSKGLSGLTRYEFDPPKSFQWVVLMPVE